MGLLDRFRGKDTAAPPASDLASEGLSSSQTSQASASEFSELVPYDGLAQQEGPGPSGRIYNPYEGLNTALDGRSLKGGYQLPSQPEFLFSEEATVHRRSWSENLTYYTGTGYLTGKSAADGYNEARRSFPPAQDTAFRSCLRIVAPGLDPALLPEYALLQGGR